MKDINDYYKILETNKNSTDNEIKQNYIKLKNKFDPNNYEKENLKKIAEEKTKEIEKAFDEIMNSRRLERIQSGKSTFDSSSNQSFNATASEHAQEYPTLQQIESLIDANELEKAQHLLNSISENNRPAHWFFLKGLLLFKKGWLEEATNFLSAALRMDPTNERYAQTLQQIRWQRNGRFDPFNQQARQGQNAPYYPQSTNCVFCDTCMGMMCANAICSCCGDNAMGGC